MLCEMPLYRSSAALLARLSFAKAASGNDPCAVQRAWLQRRGLLPWLRRVERPQKIGIRHIFVALMRHAASACIMPCADRNSILLCLVALLLASDARTSPGEGPAGAHDADDGPVLQQVRQDLQG